VVDEDVDPSSLADVMWAITTRAEPSESVDIIREAWSSALDPRIAPELKLKGVTSHSKMIINACKPFAWKSQFPPASALSPDELNAVERTWGHLLR
jgi:4-hydroxy-3-polyprenylbenzoate decarboxylase